MANANETAPAAGATPAPETTAIAETTATPLPRSYGIVKEYLETGSLCRVTFTLPKEAAPEAQTVHIVGEFNDWSTDANLMQRHAGGEFSITLDLEKNRAYRFRYLIDGTTYENDWAADRYEPNPFGGEDSVVEV